MNIFATTWKGRMRLARALPQAGFVLTTSLLVALLAMALVPPALTLVLGEIVSRVQAPTSNVLSSMLWPLAIFAGVLVLGQLAEAIIKPVEYLLVNRIDGAHRAWLSRMITAVPTIEVLEQSNVQGMIREVEADPRNGFESTPGQGAAAQLRWFTGLIGIIFSGVVLARFAWWLPFVIILPATVNSMLRNLQSAKATRLWQKAVVGELHADVWRKATIMAGPSKETRIFGLTEWMVNRMQKHITAANMPLWRYINRTLIDEWSQLLLVLMGLIPAYMAVTLGVLSGVTTLAILTIVLSAGAAVYRDLAASATAHHITGGATILDTAERLRKILYPGANEAASPQSVPALQRAVAASHTVSVDKVVSSQSVPNRLSRIVFDEVTFHYPQSCRLVLDRLTFEIGAGDFLALVGLNGSGKSTIIKLLTGLYAPTAGRILIDDQDLTEIDLAEWRARIAVVFQDFIHYPLSARQNVTFAGDQTTSFLNPTTASSGIATVIDRLPQGWETPLTRSLAGGTDLSGGQWQQVALARALHRVHEGAGLLVLDEPTAHLDVRTEAKVFGCLEDLQGRTGKILISHRLATVRNADRIVLLADGQIVESGTHAELMALRGRYHEMFSIQAQRFAQGYNDRIEEKAW